MSQTTSSTYFLLDSQQGRNAEKGWRIQALTNLQVTPQGLQLSPLPSPPVPLKDGKGTFGKMTNPTGVVVDSHGVIYIADAEQHQIFKLTRRDSLQVWATFFRISQGPFASDRFVYIPAANRLERWQASRQEVPQSFDAVEVIRDRVFDAIRARQLILCYIQTHEPDPSPNPCPPEPEPRDLDRETIAECWEAPYPLHLPAGKICKSSIEILPALGGFGNAPRQFNEPRGLAISKTGNLYVADTKNHRIQVFALPTLVLQAIWGKKAGAADVTAPVPTAPECELLPERIRWGQPIAGSNPGEFNEPWDVVVNDREMVYIADRNNHRLQKVDPRTGKFTPIDGTRLNAHCFQVIYGTQKGERFVFIPARRRLERWSSSLGRDPNNESEISILGTTIDTQDAARQLIIETLNARGATDILLEWDRDYPLESDAGFDSPTHLAIDANGFIYVVDQAKSYVKVLDHEGRVLKNIEFVGDVFGRFPPSAIAVDVNGKLVLANDKGLHRFDWKTGDRDDGCCGIWKDGCTSMTIDINGDLIVVGSGGVGLIPPATELEKKGIYFSQSLDSDIYRCQWHKIMLDAGSIPTGTSIKVWTYTSEIELLSSDIQALQPEDWHTGQVNASDFLILSPPGRFLWLKIELAGNGIDTPLLQRLKVYFPRSSYLQYLPAVYQADPISKDFLERFLSIFETVLGGVETKIDRIAQYFDPDGVPDRAFLEWLAGWVDMTFYQSWSLETCRRLLRHAPELYRLRGTPVGLKRWLSLAFGVEAEILEHFRLRQGAYLNQQFVLGERSHLWNNSLLDRWSLGDTHLSELPLEGTEPIVDRLSATAHRFTVFIPATQLRSPARERQIRALIDAEKPGHTQYALNSVEPRLRVGVQSRLGMDTLVGDYPRLVLNHCSTLGYNAVLNRAPEAKTDVMQVGDRRRIGVNSVVR